MTTIKHIIKISIVATLAFVLSGCLNEYNNLEQNAIPTPESTYVEGELMVKFTPEVEELLATRSDLTRSGIPTVDEVLTAVGGYQLERVFPVDSKREQLTRDNGLHLWYVVRFKGESADEVAEKLAKLGEVQGLI